MSQRAAVVEVASSSSPGVTYRVWVGEDGPIFCDCPGHKFVRADGVRRICKHMKAIAGDSVALTTATSLVRTGTAAPKQHKPGIRFIEMQERESTDTAWVTVTDLSRFNNLEV